MSRPPTLTTFNFSSFSSLRRVAGSLGGLGLALSLVLASASAAEPQAQEGPKADKVPAAKAAAKPAPSPAKASKAKPRPKAKAAPARKPAPPKVAPKPRPKATPKPRPKATPKPRPKAKARPARRPAPQKPPPPPIRPSEPVPARPAIPSVDAAPAAQEPGTAGVPKPLPLGRREAEVRYRDGTELERKGDLQGSFQAFREAAEAGYGLAQKKLGDLFGTGNDVVARDYETSLRWYQKAREQGIHVPKPFTYPGIRR